MLKPDERRGNSDAVAVRRGDVQSDFVSKCARGGERDFQGESPRIHQDFRRSPRVTRNAHKLNAKVAVMRLPASGIGATV